MSHQLQGDGLNLPFFNLLWSKSSNDIEKPNNKKQQCILRIPDTVIFLFGQPQSWFFTSKNGGEKKDSTTILSKRKANITLANIEEAFLQKANTGTRRGAVGEEDVVAYFISSNSDGDDSSVDEHALEASDIEASTNSIEYFNKKTLHDFLQHGRHNKSGILQRFIAPHGGGTHNSQIRAIWTPKLCVLERRRTKQDIHDTRFALYERCITFDGPDVHSVSVPLRGSVLSGRVETICNEIVRHIAEVSSENTHGRSDDSFLGVARMVVNFKVDGNGKIWILWSNSTRLQNVAMDSETKLTTEPDNTSILQAAPLNMETVVRLPSTVKLTQAPNHNKNLKPENQLLSETCPSCNRQDDNPHFQPVPYKTVITHFEKTLEMLEEEDESRPSKVWPPEDRFIKAAGNVGFGSLSLQLARDRQGNNRSTRKHTEETHTIPPVIRQIHPKLRAKGFEMYRNDPLFLLKNCSVCEDCFLAYSSLATNNFTHITRPVEPFASEQQEIRYEFPIDDKKNKEKHREDSGKENKDSSGTTTGIFANIGSVPELPPAISSPPKTANSESSKTTTAPLQPKDTLFNTMNTYFPDTNTETAKTNLEFLVDSHKKMVKRDSDPPLATKTSNPYSEKLERMIT